jgi:hypothetical protein
VWVKVEGKEEIKVKMQRRETKYSVPVLSCTFGWDLKRNAIPSNEIE